MSARTRHAQSTRRDVRRLAAAVAEDRLTQPSTRIGWQTFLRQLHRHHSTEDAALWLLVRAAVTDPEDLVILDDMDAEHTGIGELSTKKAF